MFSKILATSQRRWLLILPFIGFLILIIMVKLKPAPQLKKDIIFSPLVEIEKAEIRKLTMSITGYGRAHAKKSWQALSEVTGRVIYRHPNLEEGNMLRTGTVAFKIDPVDYQLKLAQAKFDLNSAIADADRIALKENKQTLSLELSINRLRIIEKEYKRKKGLLKSASISQSSVDKEQSNVFDQQEKVLELETSLKLIPNDIDVAQARIQVNQSRVQEAKRKLDKTQINIPFNARITQVNAVMDQVINKQSILLQADHIGTMEVDAQFAITDIKQLFRQSISSSLLQGNEFPDIKRLKLQTKIRLYSGDDILEWPGKVTRVSDSIDPQGNTVGLTVEIKNDWKNMDHINDSPVVKDMFLEVQIMGDEKQILSVPTEAIHGGSIYIVEGDTLKIKPVNPLFESGRYTAIDASLENTISVNDLIVITDLLPAIENMTVRTVMGQSK
ncbi:hypothetical protein CXF85_22540 [Colwellia sp. 75C3]|uniref:efflux RND transporter periplasmic adaptor subunit n=1 Tax=Colwellia sp. 75C3 TaxID=888425 RepID=UPI000C32B9CB|nr:hypothetical protein [Colwellia sp. 75C3]PKG80884.1 hypothetical protein CXF85_22540 [Colwellia sp. 75C3]